MNKIELPYFPKFFDRYIHLVDVELFLAFEVYSPEKVFSKVVKLKSLKDRVYEEGKWTIKDILQHCIDTERVMAFRAMCFARNEQAVLPGFDENQYALNTTASTRTIDDLLEEYILLRQSTFTLFKSMNEKMLLNEGQANNTSIYPLALGYVVIGHAIHHMNVIEERYFPLLD